MSFWQYHDRLMDSCDSEARKPTIEITHPVNRLEAGPKWASLQGEALGVTDAEMQAILQRTRQLIQTTHGLCSWIGTSGNRHRAPHLSTGNQPYIRRMITFSDCRDRPGYHLYGRCGNWSAHSCRLGRTSRTCRMLARRNRCWLTKPASDEFT
jgi:hypothetical protein